MALRKKKDSTDEAVESPVEAEQFVAPTRFEFTAPAREVVEQLNLRVPSEHGGARNAAVACFHALNDPGGNNPTSILLAVQPDSITVQVAQTPYVHG